MFAALEQTTMMTPMDSTMQEFDDTVFDGLALEVEINELRQEVRATMTTIDELNALHASIEAHGLSVALLQFANTNNALSLVIPEIPSLESMSVESTDEARDAALEGILRTVGDLVGGVITKIKAMGAKIISSIKLWFESTTELQKQTAKYKAAVAGKAFDTELFTTLTSKLIPCNQLIELIDLGPANSTFTFAIMKMKVPETNTDREIWLTEYHKLYAKYIGGFSIVKNEWVLKPKPTSTTYTAAGYTEKSFDDIVNHLEAFVEDELHNYDSLCAEFERYEDYVMRRLDELTVTNTTSGHNTQIDPETNRPKVTIGKSTTVTKTEGAKILDYVFDLSGEHYIRNRNISWKDGARRGLRVLNDLTKAYK
jgi:hypothetical protein